MTSARTSLLFPAPLNEPNPTKSGARQDFDSEVRTY